MKKRILSMLMALLMVLSLVPTMVFADVVASGTCGASGSNLTWTLDSEGTLTISGTGKMKNYGDAPASDVHAAPWRRYNLQSLVIESGVTSIGGYTFMWCENLTSVTIPDSVTSIGEAAFFGCNSLTSITIPDSVTSIGYSAFEYCNSLQSVTIPDSVTNIGSSAFSRCNSLQSVTIPDSVTNIGNLAFFICGSLANVVIPSSVTSIGERAFCGCSSLAGIWVDDDNTVYCSDTNGILFNKDKTALIQSPGGFNGTCIIPSGVTSIGNGAFFGCSSLMSVTIPDSVTSIGHSAFSGCSSLQSVTIPYGVTTLDESTFSYCSSLINMAIPVSVTSIADDAFCDCYHLENVYYGGTQAQWSNISIDYYANEPLRNATIHYNHIHQYIQDTVVKPTCTEPGYTEHLCAYGETVRDSYTAPLGHTHAANDQGMVTRPTCAEQGYTTYTCTRCGESYQSDFVDALPHDYKAVVTSPTCTEQGYTTYTCTQCGYSYTDDYTDVAGHHIVVDAAVEATCGEDGHTIGSHCDRCGQVFIPPTVIPATGEHVSTGAHCATTSHRAICDVCGQEYGELLAVSCDLNGDGDTDTDDLTMLVRHVAKIELIEEAELLDKADLDGSDTVDAVDVTILAQALAK